jgi:hypothetical protein
MRDIRLEYGIPYSEIIARAGWGQGVIARLEPDFFVRPIDIRTKLSDIALLQKPARRMDKRDRFISELRDDVRAKGLSFRVDYRKGKGGHAMVYVGDRLTTLPSREIDPKTARKIRKHLGLAD